MDFFSLNALNCNTKNYITGLPFGVPKIERKESDLIIIKAKSKVELKISGYLYGLFCNNSDQVNVKLVYNSNIISGFYINEFNDIQRKKHQNLYKKISKIKVKSKNTKIELK